jgi:hypothetical protein
MPTFLELFQSLIEKRMANITYEELEILKKGPPFEGRAESYMCTTAGLRKDFVKITAMFNDIDLFNKFIEWFNKQDWYDNKSQYKFLEFFKENMENRMGELLEEDKRIIGMTILPKNEASIISGAISYKSSGW